MKEISTSCCCCCCIHRFFYLSYETLKLLQICLFSSPTSALLAWTLSCWGWSAFDRDSCEQTVHGFSIRLAAAVLQDTNYREKMEHFFCIFITDWCSCVELLTTRLWSCVDIFFSHLHWRSEPELSTPRISFSFLDRIGWLPAQRLNYSEYTAIYCCPYLLEKIKSIYIRH